MNVVERRIAAAALPCALTLLCVAAGCRGDAAATREGEAAEGTKEIQIDAPVVERGDVPETAGGFLERLVPLPSPGLQVTYDVTGPGGLEGSLVVWTRPGGWRREAWTLRVPVPDEDDGGDDGIVTQVQGLTIQTPDVIWTAVGEQPGTRQANQLGELARAYLALEPRAQADVVAALDDWYAKLDEAREESPGERETMAGQDCLRTRVAAQNLCVWEQAGIALSYAGAEFSLRATAIDRSPTLEPSTFELPARAKDATEVPAPEAGQVDATAAMRDLANGDYAPLALVLTPGFRVPMAPTPAQR